MGTETFRVVMDGKGVWMLQLIDDGKIVSDFPYDSKEHAVQVGKQKARKHKIPVIVDEEQEKHYYYVTIPYYHRFLVVAVDEEDALEVAHLEGNGTIIRYDDDAALVELAAHYPYRPLSEPRTPS